MKINYQTTFVLDTHGWNEPLENLIESIKKTVEELDGEVKSVNNLGLKQFARIPRKEFIEGHYVKIECAAPSTFAARLQERVRLNSNVNRAFVESVDK